MSEHTSPWLEHMERVNIRNHLLAAERNPFRRFLNSVAEVALYNTGIRRPNLYTPAIDQAYAAQIQQKQPVSSRPEPEVYTPTPRPERIAPDDPVWRVDMRSELGQGTGEIVVESDGSQHPA